MINTTPDYRYLYELTNNVTPLKTDCGSLCESICCRPNNKHKLGVYLFPGEQEFLGSSKKWYKMEFHHPKHYDFPENWTEPVPFISCLKPCPRESRPLACRFFPLTAHLLKDETLLIIHETMELPYKCPLITQKMKLQPEFIETVAAAWQTLLKSPLIRQLVEEDSIKREESCPYIPSILWSSTVYS